ncbi:MAG: hypothetical protein OSA51_00045 [Octadecabacter sp.]|nr:hypothetical protein [Octadecabacter sp.]
MTHFGGQLTQEKLRFSMYYPISLNHCISLNDTVTNTFAFENYCSLISTLSHDVMLFDETL